VELVSKKVIPIKTEWWTPRLAGPVFAAAAVRFALMAVSLVRSGTSAVVTGDSMSFLVPGRNLLLHGRFIADGVPDVIRTPGYPLFVAIFSLGNQPVAAVENVILSVFSVVLVWRLGQRVFADDRIALGAAWIFAFEPLSALYSFFLMSDTLFLTLLLLGMERIAEFLRGRSLRVLAAAGLWLAAATFVRPITYYLPFALALGLFLALARVPGLLWKAPAVLLISVLPWLAAWQIRNRVETGYGGFSSVEEYNLFFIDSAVVTARVERRNFFAVRKALGFVGEQGYTGFNNDSKQQYLYQPYLALHPEQIGWSQGQRLDYMHSEAVRVIRSHYGVYLRTCLAALYHVIIGRGDAYYDALFDPGDPSRFSTGLLKRGGAARVIALTTTHPWKAVEKASFEIMLLGLYLFATRGIVLIARGVFHGGMCNACLWMMLGTSLYLLTVSAFGMTLAGPRFRLPVMPVVCILAAAGARRAPAESGWGRIPA
jgi:hypothetical protein